MNDDKLFSRFANKEFMEDDELALDVEAMYDIRHQYKKRRLINDYESYKNDLDKFNDSPLAIKDIYQKMNHTDDTYLFHYNEHIPNAYNLDNIKDTENYIISNYDCHYDMFNNPILTMEKNDSDSIVISFNTNKDNDYYYEKQYVENNGESIKDITKQTLEEKYYEFNNKQDNLQLNSTDNLKEIYENYSLSKNLHLLYERFSEQTIENAKEYRSIERSKNEISSQYENQFGENINKNFATKIESNNYETVSSNNDVVENYLNKLEESKNYINSNFEFTDDIKIEKNDDDSLVLSFSTSDYQIEKRYIENNGESIQDITRKTLENQFNEYSHQLNALQENSNIDLRLVNEDIDKYTSKFDLESVNIKYSDDTINNANEFSKIELKLLDVDYNYHRQFGEYLINSIDNKQDLSNKEFLSNDIKRGKNIMGTNIDVNETNYDSQRLYNSYHSDLADLRIENGTSNEKVLLRDKVFKELESINSQNKEEVFKRVGENRIGIDVFSDEYDQVANAEYAIKQLDKRFDLDKYDISLTNSELSDSNNNVSVQIHGGLNREENTFYSISSNELRNDLNAELSEYHYEEEKDINNKLDYVNEFTDSLEKDRNTIDFEDPKLLKNLDSKLNETNEFLNKVEENNTQNDVFVATRFEYLENSLNITDPNSLKEANQITGKMSNASIQDKFQLYNHAKDHELLSETKTNLSNEDIKTELESRNITRSLENEFGRETMEQVRKGYLTSDIKKPDINSNLSKNEYLKEYMNATNNVIKQTNNLSIQNYQESATKQLNTINDNQKAFDLKNNDLLRKYNNQQKEERQDEKQEEQSHDEKKTRNRGQQL